MPGFEKRLRRRLLTPAMMAEIRFVNVQHLIFLSQNSFRLKLAEVVNIILSVFY